MSGLAQKIDFSVILTVTKANPNGDPLNGNRPREDYDGFGEISDVCLKRKIRNRLQDMGESIFVQSQERADDGATSLSDRVKSNADLKVKENEKFQEIACSKWFDVRAFGQVFAFKAIETKGLSVGVRGPVTIQTAVSVEPVVITTMQITKSVNSETTATGGKSSDTMGTKSRVEFGVYRFSGSINCQLADKTGFSDEDAEKIREALITLFDNDASSARPEGSIEVKRVYWWKHNCKSGQYPSAKVHRSVSIVKKDQSITAKRWEDYDVHCEELEGLACEVYEG